MDVDFVEPDRALLNSDDEFNDDEECHEKLVDAIASMDDKKKSNIRQRCEVSKTVSDLHVPLGTGKVELGDLVGALTDKAKGIPLRKQLNRITKSQSVLPTPLYRAEQERVTRDVAYNETKEEVDKWEPIVEKNRVAEHQEFPLQKPDLRLITGSTFVKRFTAHSKLEKEVARLLGNTVEESHGKNPLTRAEQRAFKAMDLEEARQKRAELQRHRELLTRKEAKARWQKKIKSKRYHRTLRQEKARAQKQALAELEKNDPEAFLEKMMPRDRDRIQERASLKHRGASKRMKKATIYGKYDDTAREMVQQMNQKSRELTQKVLVESESEEEQSEEEEEKKVTTSSSNPWMGIVPERSLRLAPTEVKATEDDQSEAESIEEEKEEEEMEKDVSEAPSKPSQKRKKDQVEQDTETGKNKRKKRKKQMKEEDLDIDALFDDLKKKTAATLSQELRSEAKAKGTKKQRPRKNKRAMKADVAESNSDEDEDEDSEEEEEVCEPTENDEATESLISSSTKRKRTLEDFDGDMSEEEVEETKKTRIEPPKIAKPMRKEHIVREIKVIPEKEVTREHELKTSAGNMVENEESEDEEEAASTQRMTIAAAFADDDVVGEFEEEKKKIMDAQKPKDIDLTLPGWGSWGGAGITISKKKRKRFTIKAPPAAPRRDAHLHNVIISETKDNSIAKHQVSELPHCYKNVHQFEYTIKQPIGKTWNSETAYRKMIVPKVSTMMGTIIDPINKEDTFKNMKKKAVEVQKPKQNSKKQKKRK